ncbi:hypothetical protein KUCAC02_007307, partial [Chaenocephalus aceratus]
MPGSATARRLGGWWPVICQLHPSGRHLSPAPPHLSCTRPPSCPTSSPLHPAARPFEHAQLFLLLHQSQ